MRIIHRDLVLKCVKKCAQELTEANRCARLSRSKQLLKRYSARDVEYIWFTDEKVFSVAAPKNPQNDRLYVTATFCCSNICCRAYVTSPASSSSFQQDSAPAHRARETIRLLERETPAFISPDLWPPNSPHLSASITPCSIPFHTSIRRCLKSSIYQAPDFVVNWTEAQSS